MLTKGREFLIIILICILAIFAFGAGFLANDLIELQTNQDDFSVFWEAWGRIEESYIGQLPETKQMTYGAVRGAIGVLNDPYTVFIEPADREQERANQRGNIGGVGATLQRDEEGQIILTPIPGNPAELAGILEGDVLLAVDGMPVTTEMTVQEIALLVRGEEGTEVTLSVLHPGAIDPADIRIVRAVILLSSVSY